MTTAITSALGAFTGALGSQSRPAPAYPGRRVDTSTQAIALSRDVKTAKHAKRNADSERLMELLTDPQVMGILTVFGGLFLAQQIPWSSDQNTNGAIKGVASSAAVLMGLGRAGVGDLTTLAFASAAGIAGSGLVSVSGLGGNDQTKWPLTATIAGYPVASVFGPIPLTEWLIRKANESG